MVNLTYRNVAQLQKAREIVTSGQIGAVKHVEASYLQSWLVSKAWGDWRTESKWLWRLSKKHGSTACSATSASTSSTSRRIGSGLDIEHVFARLKTFDKAPGNKIGEYELDANDSFTMAVDFSNGALGVIHATRWATGHFNELRLRVYGERGGVEVQHRHDGSRLRVCLGEDVETGTWKEMEVPPVPTNYQRFADGGAGRARTSSRTSATPPSCRRCSTSRWCRTPSTRNWRRTEVRSGQAIPTRLAWPTAGDLAMAAGGPHLPAAIGGRSWISSGPSSSGSSPASSPSW